MAVFTKLDEKDINEFLTSYNLGKLNSYQDIVEGIENTNYKIICDGAPYILTIFEKRVNKNDLPFFMDLKFYLNENNFSCPKPIKDIYGNVINSLKNKKAVIISFIEGNKIEISGQDICKEIGKITGKLHKLTNQFDLKRKNSLSLEEWKKIFFKCSKEENSQFKEILDNLKIELPIIEKKWPKHLPSGIIHADLFKDNIFFIDNKVSGVIDFYFSCYDFYLYDIAILVNDWCFEKKGSVFNKNLFNSILNGYNSERKLQDIEIESFNIILRAAAVRILVTRLHDFMFHPNDAIVIKKDPIEYYEILKWHQHNSVIEV